MLSVASLIDYDEGTLSKGAQNTLKGHSDWNSELLVWAFSPCV